MPPKPYRHRAPSGRKRKGFAEGGKVLNSLYEAKTNLSALVERAAAGEEIIITKNGVPKARLVPMPKVALPRKPGGWEGRVWMSDDFDDPLPDDIQAAFEGRDDDEPAS